MRRLLLSLAFIAAPALAQNLPPPTGPRPPAFRQGPTIVAEPVALTLAGFDADQDGLLTRAEAAAGAARSFAAVARGAADLGYIGYSDWAVRWLGDANALPSPYEVDGDRNDRITAAEIAAALDAAFVRFDANKDGTLTRAELITIRATMFGSDRAPKGKPPKQP
ncbi:MAG: EF-hand domain-containing protein [Pseudomonadota bacterium]